ncbi:MAG: hypothetical protein RBU30_17915, partial [Polyangia bacterium]|nr:hypothetical protein [Polyangia bacterium]
MVCWRTHLPRGLPLAALLCLGAAYGGSSCVFDRGGFSPPPRDGSPSEDAAPISDAAPPDVAPPWDAGPPDVFVPPCTHDLFECLPGGTARLCQDGSWTDLGPCPLGCDAPSRICRVPSNVPAELADDGDGVLDLDVVHTPVRIDTDTGRIYTPSGPEHRPAGLGLDPASGIHYSQLPQGGLPGMGVLVLGDLTVKVGVDVILEGSRSLVILAQGTVSIQGLVYLNSKDSLPGPGGYSGGLAGQVGGGGCGGQLGAGTTGEHGCSSGGGGGGHGGVGGAGGNATCGSHVGGSGGGTVCSNQSLIPLVGGAGGSGGAPYAENVNSVPGAGGGGALQVSAAQSITVFGDGRLHAGGGPGAGCSWAGGAGGGAGGALLLESPSVTLASGSILAAIGGGG